jgi:hypothetical protein
MKGHGLVLLAGVLLLSDVAAAQDCHVPENFRDRCASGQWRTIGDRRIAFCYSYDTAGPIVRSLAGTDLPGPGSWSCGDVVCWSWDDDGRPTRACAVLLPLH